MLIYDIFYQLLWQSFIFANNTNIGDVGVKMNLCQTIFFAASFSYVCFDLWALDKFMVWLDPDDQNFTIRKKSDASFQGYPVIKVPWSRHD